MTSLQAKTEIEENVMNKDKEIQDLNKEMNEMKDKYEQEIKSIGDETNNIKSN